MLRLLVLFRLQVLLPLVGGPYGLGQDYVEIYAILVRLGAAAIEK